MTIEARQILGTATVDGTAYPIVEYLGIVPVDASGRLERVCVVQTPIGDRYVIDCDQQSLLKDRGGNSAAR
jgi:hypothetical protein